jgi:hypothetical protein
MTLELAARLAVLLACAVAAGALYVRLARSGPGAAGDPSTPRPIPGAVSAALGAFVVVAGGAALSGIGLGAEDGAGLALLRAAGIVLLAAAGLLAVVPLPGRGTLGPPALVGLAWLGAGMALAAPLVLIVAALVIALLAVRVTGGPPT